MRILIPVVVGAIIGYCTNWLAIKMLFRPHYEKRIMGFRIPFTPGLIPKESRRIAKSIGEAVGVYLLSPDTIIDALNNENTEKQMVNWIKEKVDKLKKNTKSIKEIIMDISQDAYNRLKTKISSSITKIIIDKIREEKFRQSIYKSIEEKIDNIDSENLYRLIDDKLKGLLDELSNSNDIKAYTEHIIKSKIEGLTTEERTLSQIIPDDIIKEIYTTIDKNQDPIGKSIRDNFKDPELQEKIGLFLTELVLQHVPKLILTFVNADMISGKILQIIEKYVDNEETDKYIIIFIKLSLDKLLDSKAKDLMPNLDTNNINLEKYGDTIIKALLKEDNQNLIFEILNKKLRDLEGNAKENLLKYIKDNLDEILNSKGLEELLSKSIEEILEEFALRPVNSHVAKIQEKDINKLYGFLKTIFKKFAKEELPQIIEFFNISKIVEDKINSFDVDFTEELILDIAQKELKAITWLGALLGGVMGLLTPLLQYVY